MGYASRFAVLLLAAAAVLGGCAAWTDYAEVSSEVAQSPLEPGAWRSDFETSPIFTELVAWPTTLAGGDTLAVTVTIENTLDVPLGIGFADGCTSGWSLWSGGVMVARSPGACTMAPVNRVIPPGRQAPYTITWVWDGQSPEPGTYRFAAGLGSVGTMDGGEVEVTLVEGGHPDR